MKNFLGVVVISSTMFLAPATAQAADPPPPPPGCGDWDTANSQQQHEIIADLQARLNAQDYRLAVRKQRIHRLEHRARSLRQEIRKLRD